MGSLHTRYDIKKMNPPQKKVRAGYNSMQTPPENAKLPYETDGMFSQEEIIIKKLNDIYLLEVAKRLSHSLIGLLWGFKFKIFEDHSHLFQMGA